MGRLSLLIIFKYGIRCSAPRRVLSVARCDRLDVVDAVIPTIDRPFLEESRASLLNQGIPVNVAVVTDTHHRGQFRIYEKFFGSTGAPYVLFFADDDALVPGALTKLIEALESHPEAGYAWGWVKHVGRDENVVRDLGTSSVLWRRSFLQKMVDTRGYIFRWFSFTLGEACLFAELKNANVPGVEVRDVVTLSHVHRGQLTWVLNWKVVAGIFLSGPIIGYGPRYAIHRILHLRDGMP